MAAMVVTFAQVAESEPRCVARALKERDAEFISRLASEYHYRLLRYLTYLTSRLEQAEDLVQETWIRVIERAGQFDGKSRFEPWLFSIARNLAIDELRKRKKGDSGDVPDVAAPETQSPFLAAARSEDAVRLAGALDGLDPIYREALLLRFQEDLSLEEIAQVAGAPVSTIASRIYRGLAILRSHLQGGGGAI